MSTSSATAALERARVNILSIDPFMGEGSGPVTQPPNSALSPEEPEVLDKAEPVEAVELVLVLEAPESVSAVALTAPLEPVVPVTDTVSPG